MIQLVMKKLFIKIDQEKFYYDTYIYLYKHINIHKV